MEKALNTLLQELKTLASKNKETNVSSKLVLKAVSSFTSGLWLAFGKEPKAMDYLMCLFPPKEIYEFISWSSWEVGGVGVLVRRNATQYKMGRRLFRNNALWI